MHSPWRLNGRRATLELGPLTASVDFDNPEPGLDHLSLRGYGLSPADLFRVDLPLSRRGTNRFIDADVRGADLIASYAENVERSLNWQVYWRACSERFPGTLAAIEAIVSVQTDLLETEPEMFLASQLPTRTAINWRTETDGKLKRLKIKPPVCGAYEYKSWACFGFELPDGLAYVELIHPDNFFASHVELGNEETPGSRFYHSLFGDRLEKGVILRSRALGLFLPRLPTTADIAELKRRLMDEALPLTT